MSRKYKGIATRISGENYDKRIVKPDSVYLSIDQIWEKGHAQAEDVGLGAAVYKHLRWRKGFMYCFSGWPGSGKSELVNYLAVQRSIKYKTKVAMYSPENYPIEHLVENLIRCYLGKSVEKGYNNQCTKEELEEAKEFLKTRFRFIQFDDIPNHLDVINEFQRLYEEEGYEMFILDPFNAILNANNESISQYFQAALTQFKMFASNNKIIMVHIEHPRRENLKDGKRAEPSPWILYGGSMWWNKSDVIVTIDRDQEHNSNVPAMKVWKVKNQRLNGKPGEVDLEYDFSTSRFKCLTPEPKI